MSHDIRCPFCPLAPKDCPHLLILMSRTPGEVLAGPLAPRMNRMWQLITEGVGEDPGGVLFESWENLRHQVAAEADQLVEEGGCAAIFVADATRMEAVIEACFPIEEL